MCLMLENGELNEKTKKTAHSVCIPENNVLAKFGNKTNPSYTAHELINE